ncbi:mucolipin-3-like isoform X1 [Bolinopsis microptera]|uniref:mucolipin-3-like isoform X1 n=1 Tax=Bolinopsis microptera TaxID=2820187 RepID=UPI00307A6A70
MNKTAPSSYSFRCACDGTSGRGSSQIAPVHLVSPPRLYKLPRAVSTSEGTSSDTSDSDTSDNSRCPFLNKEHLPEFQAMRDQLRDFFRNKNRMEQLTKRPWIFLLQFLKLCLITAMLISLTDNNYGIKNAVHQIKEAVSSLLIEDYDPTVEPKDRKVYSFDQLENMANHALGEYFCLSDTAISLLGYPNGLRPEIPPPVEISIEHFANVTIDSQWNVSLNETIQNFTTSVSCHMCDYTCVNRSRDRISARQFSLGLQKYKMLFPLQLLLIGYLSRPHCVALKYEIIFSNSLETGLETDLWMHYDFGECKSNPDNMDDEVKYYNYIALDVSVMLLSIASTITVIRKMILAFQLYVKTQTFMGKTYKRRLNKREKHLFVNYWFVCILLADMLLFTAAVLKLCIDIGTAYNFDMCTLFLGIGVWLSYLGLLRYLFFDKHYSMILNTIVLALPHLARFMICVIIVSLAYIFCGWLVLSPYNRKFTTFWVTMETLFSLLNGDDMFATFDLVKTRSMIATQQIILVFSRIYLYSYVCFFIYVVLSLCISIIEDAYTIVSNYRSDSCPWLQDRGLFPEFATSWEQNLLRTDLRHNSRHSRHDSKTC